MDCIFCKIAKGEIDSVKVWEDNDIFIFLDVNPITKGHCLVIPKKHFENIFDIDENILKKITIAGKHISEKIKKNLNADGIRLSQSNGKTAGQEMMHFHLHVIPRYEGDGLGVKIFGSGVHPQKADIGELKKIAEKIKL
jgi:histidine triad (HIT) family protein